MTSQFSFRYLIVLAIAGYTLATTHQTNGSGGDLCNGERCLSGKASCVNNKCVCNSEYAYGDGKINCYKKNEFRTEVTNDPNILTYNNNSVDLPIPCRYLLTHAVTEYKNRDRVVVGSCELMVHTFHLKHRGKFYVGGYDAAIRVECNNGSRHEWSIRKYGWAANGQYDFVVNSTDGTFLPNGPWGSDNIDFYDPSTNLRIKCKTDNNNNLVMLVVKKCGFRIRFRPYDKPLRRRQPFTPGMAVAVNCAFHPEFESVDKTMALPPMGNHNGFNISSIQLPGLGFMETLIHRAYISGVEQNQPGLNPMCTDAKTSLTRCNSGTLRTALEECVWILRSPRFIRCYDSTSTGYFIQELFNRCVDVYCSSFDCNNVIGMITSRNCTNVPGYPALTNFLSGSRC